MSAWPKPSRRFAEYVRRVSACGHWRQTGRRRSDAVEIEHVETGRTLWYGTHDGGNDLNSARNFAADAQRECGCRLVEARGRKRSRKAVRVSGFGLTATYSHSTQQDVDRLVREWHEVDGRLSQIEHIAHAATRDDVAQARELIKRRAVIESELVRRHQPVPERRS